MSAPKRLLETVPDGAVLTRDQAQALIQRVIGMSKADAVQVSVTGGYGANVRFAANQMSTSGAITNLQVAVQSSFGPKSAVVVTNDDSDEALRRTVEQSEALARLAPDNPEAMPPLAQQPFREVPAYFGATADAGAAERAMVARTALDPARATEDMHVAGFLATDASISALGNSAGLFAYHRGTSANYTVTARTTDGTGSGWAGSEHPDWRQVDFGAVSARAIDKARRSRSPQAIEPGRYTVILEPQAVGDLVQLLGFYAAARAADEGRSAFAKQGGGNRLGEKIVDSRISIVADPFDPRVLAQPFDGDGLPLGRQVLVRDGVLENLYYSRFWAQKQGKEPTGAPTSVIVSGSGETMSIEEMIAGTPRGVLVTRLWYLREVDPRTILYTGLTRDGTFLIENGRVTRAVKNMRFNESPLFMLNNLEAVGTPVRLAGTEAGGAVVMPPVKVRDFNFTSLSDAV
ncbi:MAG TPA: TldD/PmbA family protein [Gemmatimonadaceae bacterium]|nr:TldD/PmbA family protein [Gemmatimonadaceae bacterium]